MNRRSLLVVVACLGAHAKAGAYQAQVCVEVNVVYTDAGFQLTNGVKEDNWQTQSWFRAPRGAKYTVMRGGTTVSQGWLGDGYDANVPAGCTPSFDVAYSQTHTIYVWSQGVVQSNDLVSVNHNRYTRYVYSSLGVPPSGQSTVQIIPTGSNPSDTAELEDVFEAYVAGAYALYRHAGGETGNWYYFYRCQCTGICTIAGNPYLDSNGDADCGCAYDGQRLCTVQGNASNAFADNVDGHWRVSSMTPNSSGMKFKLIHELGHQIATTVTNSVANGGDCTDSDIVPCEANGHAMWSREYSSCAFDEGFAHFYSADVWNSHNQTDCAFKYYKWNSRTQVSWQLLDGPMIDCAADDGPDPDSSRDDFTNGQDAVPGDAMEASWIDQCSGWPYTGRGTEVDWMRVLWGVHTDGTSPPSFTTIAQWIRDSGPIGTQNAYQKLDDGANIVSGNLNSNWNINVPYFGHNIDQ